MFRASGFSVKIISNLPGRNARRRGSFSEKKGGIR